MNRMIAVVVVLLVVTAAAQKRLEARQHWQLTDSETLWIERYSNCQYSYYLLLPKGVVAHAEHPPSPHHGFLVSLPDAGSKAYISVYESNRFLWVNGEYNVTDETTLAGISGYQIGLTSDNKKNSKLVQRGRATLRSVPATTFKIEYDGPNGRIIEEELVALHSGIIYELGLRTPAEHYSEDHEKLKLILDGFRFYHLPQDQCTNR